MCPALQTVVAVCQSISQSIRMSAAAYRAQLKIPVQGGRHKKQPFNTPSPPTHRPPILHASVHARTQCSEQGPYINKLQGLKLEGKKLKTITCSVARTTQFLFSPATPERSHIAKQTVVSLAHKHKHNREPQFRHRMNETYAVYNKMDPLSSKETCSGQSVEASD